MARAGKARVVSTMKLSVGDTSARRASSREIVADIVGSAMAANEGVVVSQLKTQRRLVEEAANIEARRLMIFVTRQMMAQVSKNFRQGTASFQTITTADMMRMANALAPQRTGYTSGEARLQPQGQLRWQRLGLPWLKKKGFNKPFFVGETGELKRSLNALRSWPQTQLGGVKVRVKKRGRLWARRQSRIHDYKRPFLIGELKVEIFPGASQSAMPGLGTRDWSSHKSSEQAPGLTPAIIKKLSGPTNADIAKNKPANLTRNRRQNTDTRTALFRPMLTPAAQFWAAYRIPMAIRMAARAPLSRASKSIAFINKD